MNYAATCACGHKNTRQHLLNVACSNCGIPIPYYMWSGGNAFYEQLGNVETYGLSDEDIYKEVTKGEL